MPNRVQITISKVNKTLIDDLSFNLVGYKYENDNFIMDFSSIKPTTSIQFKLDTLAAEYGENLYVRKLSKENQFLEPVYEENEKKWIIPIYISLQDDMGSLFPVFLFIVLSQDFYHKYNESTEKITRLIMRISNWIYNTDDFNKENLSKLYSQITLILEKGEEPNFLEMKEILNMPDLERQIIVSVLKEHRSGGISLSLLSQGLRESKTVLLETAEKLAQKGILRIIKEKDVIILDTLWIV